MCGVIGLVFENDKPDMGVVASKLLRMLEYRGYDSTGAVVQDSENRITLLKDVGAPSDLTKRLGIDKLCGRIFCGQVRWATFGVVTRENAQPHEVKCKIHIYGAHNGNITNCQRLKDWLISEGHQVVSDNDGEMLVHTIEHYFHLELEYKDGNDFSAREKALRDAAIKASKKVTGSFAAVVVDPVTKIVLAIKAGSSFYIGKGKDAAGGNFIIGSSDLASVLQLTHILVPIRENEFALFTPNTFQLYDLKTGKKIIRASQRSLLKVEETKLQHPYSFFMEQEIHSQVQTSRKLISQFTGGSEVVRILRKQGKKHLESFRKIKALVVSLAGITERDELIAETRKFFGSPTVKTLIGFVGNLDPEKIETRLESQYASFLEEIRDLTDGKNSISLLPSKDGGVPANRPDGDVLAGLLLKFIDSIFELEEVEDIEQRIGKFLKMVAQARKTGNSIYMLACGSSFHAAKTAPIFFNEIAGLQVTPLLPGEFRAQCTNSLRDGDLVIGISQSGETKDLIDVFNFIAKNKTIKRICILNNTNSTLALEKSDLFIPLYCGPEIAVPATKSFLNQILLLYILSILIGKKLDETGKGPAKSGVWDSHFQSLEKIPDLLDKTFKTTQKEIDEIAADLFLAPSIHILATRILGIAKEGALKIREIVLNHTEGYEGSEFKHGPNTILGVNTVFGMDSLKGMLDRMWEAVHFALESPGGSGLDGRSTLRLIKSMADFAFQDVPPVFLNEGEKKLFKEIFANHNFFDSMYRNYPLIFITCPQEQDINLTVSQINTHKIRGANVFMIAEDNDDLREAVSLSPSAAYPYKHGYITLPRTNNQILSIFSITVVLQLLSLRMSRMKMEFLNRLEIRNHGVHPDVPKNVSKSITVD